MENRLRSHHYFHTQPYDLNCAQAILKGFQKEFNISDTEIEDYKAWGGGRAEGGMCGALFAAEGLLRQIVKDSIIQKFIQSTGSPLCLDLRNSQFTCVECIRIADELVEKNRL